MEEAKRLPDGPENDTPAKLHRKAFNAAPDRFPLLYHRSRDGARKLSWVHQFQYLAERFPKVLAVAGKNEQLKAYCNLIGSAGDWGDCPGPSHIETFKQNLRRHRQYKRRRLEGMARDLADRYKVPVYSIKFLRACQRELDRYRSRREGLREDGLCAIAYPGTMAGVEQWYEMNDDIGSNIAAAHELMDWFKAEYPLLWADYQEARRRKKQQGGSK
jgi:hypothetical protein